MHCTKRFIFMGFLLVSCGLQKTPANLLISEGGVGREAFITEIQSESVGIKTTPCCLCQKKIDDENEVWPYINAHQCLGRNESSAYQNCKVIQVQEKNCRFFEVKSSPHALTGFSCATHPLHQIENGEKKELAAPTPLLGPCGLVRNASFPAIESEQKRKAATQDWSDIPEELEKVKNGKIVCNEVSGNRVCSVITTPPAEN